MSGAKVAELIEMQFGTWRSGPPSNTWFLGPTWVNPKQNVIQFSRFCTHSSPMWLAHRHIGHTTCDICSNRPHLCTAFRQCILIIWTAWLLQKFLRSHVKKKSISSRSSSLSQVKLSQNGFEQRMKSCDSKGYQQLICTLLVPICDAFLIWSFAMLYTISCVQSLD